MPEWRDYEEVATYLLNEFAEVFRLEKVEAKQKIVGLRSNTEYELDAKGFGADGKGFVIVECKRWASHPSQQVLQEVAYQIIDTGAAGAIFVTRT